MRKKKHHKKPARFTIRFHRDPAPPLLDLAAYADALVLMQGTLALDAALNLAHNINTAAHQCEAERHLLEASAEDLRSRLNAIEERLRAARKP